MTREVCTKDADPQQSVTGSPYGLSASSATDGWRIEWANADATSVRRRRRTSPATIRCLRRMLSNCVPATTCSHSAPGLLTLTHAGLSHLCNANTSAPRADPVVNASAYRLGRPQNPMPARVMKRLVTIGSDAANPDAAIPVARPGHDLAAKPGDLGGMHLRINPQNVPQNRHVTDATDDPTPAAAVDDSTSTAVSSLPPPSVCETSDAAAAPSEPSGREPFPEVVPDTGAAA